MTVEVERLLVRHANRYLKFKLDVVNIGHITHDLSVWLPRASGGWLLNISHNDCVCLRSCCGRVAG